MRLDKASHGLHPGSTFDERYTLQNIVRLIAAGEIEPRHAYYTSLSYLPQAAVLAASDGLHRLTGIRALAVFGESRDYAHLTLTSYFLTRALNVGYSVFGLWLLYCLGRRVESPEVGVLAVALLAAAPRHVISSAHLKPDILVLLLTLAAFWLALDAAAAGREEERRRYLVAGACVGLAMSAKLTGVVAALPVIGAAIVDARPRWRVLLRLAWSGGAAALAFVALNPFLAKVWAAMRQNAAAYASRAADEEGGRWLVLRRTADFLWRQHGAVGVLLVAVGLAVLVVCAASPRTPREKRQAAGLLVVLVLAWSAALPLLTPIFRAQNYLPLLPFTALAAAWGLALLWRAGLPSRDGLFRVVALLLAGALTLWQLVDSRRPGPAVDADPPELSRLDTT